MAGHAGAPRIRPQAGDNANSRNRRMPEGMRSVPRRLDMAVEVLRSRRWRRDRALTRALAFATEMFGTGATVFSWPSAGSKKEACDHSHAASS